MANLGGEARIDGLPAEFREKRTAWEVLASEKYFKWLLMLPLLVLLAVFAFYPLFYCLYMSFHEAILVKPPEFIGWENYRKILHSRLFWDSIGRSGSAVVVCVAVEVTLGLGIALFLNREFIDSTMNNRCLKSGGSMKRQKLSWKKPEVRFKTFIRPKLRKTNILLHSVL